MHFLQVKHLLGYFEVFSHDPLLFQFPGTRVQALGPVLLLELGGGVTLGEQGLQMNGQGGWLTLLHAWISTSFLSSFWFSWSIISCFSRGEGQVRTRELLTL